MLSKFKHFLIYETLIKNYEFRIKMFHSIFFKNTIFTLTDLVI